MLDYRLKLTCDKKGAAQKFLATATPEDACLFGALADLTHSQPHCLRHSKVCVPDSGPQIVISGPPCAPYSAQRPQRYSSGLFGASEDTNLPQKATSPLQCPPPTRKLLHLASSASDM